MVRASSSTASASTTEMKRKKKKGRPSLLDLQSQNNNTNNITKKANKGFSNNITSNNNNIIIKDKSNKKRKPNYDFVPARRSTRRNPNSLNYSAFQDGNEDDDDDDDDDERKEKKVKLVVRLPQSNLDQERQEDSRHSGSGDEDEDTDLGGEAHVFSSPKKRNFDAVYRRSDDAVSDQGQKVPEVTETGHGLQLESGPTTPLPEKKLLVFILDRLQKKDTYGVFSEPVDPEELPDYHEIIEHPMDFGTVRKKLDGGLYSNLEELEADVLLICSNAMQYNAPDTVYFRQARTIRELAKRDFANLRHEGDDGEPQPKVVRRGRPPSKNQKKSLEDSPVDRIGPELLSGATLASGEDKDVGCNSYSLGKGCTLSRFRSYDAFVTPHRSRNGETNSDWTIDWNSEFPANILRADMKHGKKNFMVDENKRDTYDEYHPPGSDNDLSTLFNVDGDMKRLMAVGLHFERHAYAQSLATFAANLGPVAWKIASRKIEPVLPAGVKFGPGWVGENEVHHPQPSSYSAEKQKLPTSNLSGQMTPAPGNLSSVQSRPSEEIVDAIGRINSQSELVMQGSVSHWGVQGSSQAQQKSVLHPNRNGFVGVFAYSPSSQIGMPSGQSSTEEGLMTHQVLSRVSRDDTSSIYATPSSRPGSEESKMLESWCLPHSGNSSLKGKASVSVTDSEQGVSGRASYPELLVQHRQSFPIPPDLNVGVPVPGSPSSSLRIGSSQQPDLALQL